jgi:hypothetical protein
VQQQPSQNTSEPSRSVSTVNLRLSLGLLHSCKPYTHCGNYFRTRVVQRFTFGWRLVTPTVYVAFLVKNASLWNDKLLFYTVAASQYSYILDRPLASTVILCILSCKLQFLTWLGSWLMSQKIFWLSSKSLTESLTALLPASTSYTSECSKYGCLSRFITI